MHVVADLSHLSGEADYTMSICQALVMGTKYVRDGEPYPSSTEIE